MMAKTQGVRRVARESFKERKGEMAAMMEVRLCQSLELGNMNKKERDQQRNSLKEWTPRQCEGKVDLLLELYCDQPRAK